MFKVYPELISPARVQLAIQSLFEEHIVAACGFIICHWTKEAVPGLFLYSGVGILDILWVWLLVRSVLDLVE